MSLESLHNFGNTVKSRKNDEKLGFSDFSQSNNPTDFEIDDLLKKYVIVSVGLIYKILYFVTKKLNL